MTTYAEQLRVAKVTDLKAQYVLTMSITDRGDLPDGGAFVFEIIDEDDPKDDLYARVATVADLETYGLNRSAAVTSDTGFYRSSTVTKSYTSLRAANEAKSFLVERVNDLATEYETYIDDFKASPTAEVFTFPQADAGILAPLVTSYTDKKAERKAQKDIVDEKEAECTELTDDYNEAAAEANTAQEVLDAMNQALASLQTAKTGLTEIQTAASDVSTDIVNALTAWNTERTGMSPSASVTEMDKYLEDTTGALWSEYYDNFISAQTTLAQKIASLDAEIQKLSTTDIPAQSQRLTDANTAKTDALTAKEKCAREVAEATQVLETLEREEQSLLDEIQDLCPTFTP